MTGMTRVWAGLAFVCLLAAGAFAQGAPGLAPVNPEFEAWQAGKSAGGGHGYVPSPVDWSHLAPYMAGKADPPASYNLRTLGFVTSVKNQSVCGACWSFAACGVLEAWLKRFEGAAWDFSENHMKNTHGFDWSSCVGGNNDIANAYLTRGSGPLNEVDDPYNPTVQTPPAPGAAVQKVLTRSRVFSLGTGGDRTAVKNALMEHGALSIPMTWNDSAYNSATATYYYSGDGSQPGDGGHMVTLVGWDDAKAVPGAPGTGAWYCKNSWGAGWGDGGYFHLSYYDSQAISEAYAFTDIAAPMAYGRIYQHDPLGMTSGFGYAGTGVIFGANVFTAAETGEIAAVGTYARVPGMQLQITVYRGGYSNGFSNQAATVSATADDAGYLIVPLPAPVAFTAGQLFSVVVRYTAAGYDYPLPIEMNVPGYSSAATASVGQGYFSESGVFYQDMTSAAANASICIKAYARSTVVTPEAVIYGASKVESGAPLTLRAVASGTTGAVSYQWRKGASDLSGETGSTLHFDAVNDTHAGVYRVAVTDGSKAVTVSDPFVVEVLAPGALSVANAAGLALMVSLMGLLGLRRVRRA